MRRLPDDGMKETPHILGIIGYPLTFTLSPAIHNAALRTAKLPVVYLPFVVAPRHLPNLLRCMRLMDVEGLNVTTPHKQTVVPLLDRLDADARRIGAVNTIVRRQGKFIGYNTDGTGFHAALQRIVGRPLAGQRVTLLGAGGAARAVADVVCRNGAVRLTIVNRTVRHADALVRMLRRWRPRTMIQTVPLAASVLQRVLPQTDLLIHATASPSARLTQLVPLLKHLPREAIVADLQYTARPTLLAERAHALGFCVVDGLTILLAQAACSFSLWTNRSMHWRTAETAARRAIRAALKGSTDGASPSQNAPHRVPITPH